MLSLQTVSSVVDIEKRLIAKIKEHDSFEEPVASFVKQLTTPIISDVSLSLSRNEFDHTKQDSVVERVSSLMLYKAFFEEELVQRVMSGNIEDCNVDSRIPDDVKQDVQKMTLLKGIARRIEHMQVPRYQSLKKILLEVIKVFMKTDQVNLAYYISIKLNRELQPMLSNDDVKEFAVYSRLFSYVDKHVKFIYILFQLLWPFSPRAASLFCVFLHLFLPLLCHIMPISPILLTVFR